MLDDPIFDPKNYPKLCDVPFEKLKRFDRVLTSDGIKGEIFFLFSSDLSPLIEITLFNSTESILIPHKDLDNIHHVGPAV